MKAGFAIVKYLPFLLTAIFLSSKASAQQEPLFTQNMFYNMIYNPGFAGSENAICAVGGYRYQWAGFKDSEGNHVAPETFHLSISAPVRILRGGLGGSIINDQIGFTRTIGLRLGYAYQAKLGFGKLGIGLQAAFNNRTIDFSKFKPVDTNDPIILGGEESDMLIDFNFGLFYRVPGSYYLGISGVNILQSRGAVLTSTSSSELRMRLDRTFYVHGGYEFVFRGSPNFELHPSVVVRTNMSSYQVDLAAILKYKDLFWGGLSYRVQDAIGVIVGVAYKDFKIGYSYDINISKLKLPVGGGTHEVMLSYCFQLEIEKGRKSYRNTRFL
jgi:type IX secretion system PorP/SprF family membrane protein